MPSQSTTLRPPASPRAMAERYRRVRTLSVELCEPLSVEDMAVQVATEASPAKWHLAHTTWAIETFALEPHEPEFRPYDPAFRTIFNSYYHSVSAQFPRSMRDALTRPGTGEVLAYRDVVDERVLRLLERGDERVYAAIAPILELSLHHEQQHQELILTDVKLLLHASPLQPSYRTEPRRLDAAREPGAVRWLGVEGGVVEIGHDAESDGGFAFDNECPRHRVFLEPYEIAHRCVTNGEFLAFIEDGGYDTPGLWLDEGWSAVRELGWQAPMYWRRERDGSWSEFTMDGRQPLDPHRPVCGLGFYEAEAFARWAGARLPTEQEWEHAAAELASDDAMTRGNFVESWALRPLGDEAAEDDASASLADCFGDVWEWTRSAHEPYPGYRPLPGVVSEYNGKFMSGQFVLRGGSCATPRSHIRRTYRNFNEPRDRRQFAGLRLARTPGA